MKYCWRSFIFMKSFFLPFFCFGFQGFVLVPPNPETPSKSRDIFKFSMHMTLKVSFCCLLYHEMAERDARCTT